MSRAQGRTLGWGCSGRLWVLSERVPGAGYGLYSLADGSHEHTQQLNQGRPRLGQALDETSWCSRGKTTHLKRWQTGALPHCSLAGSGVDSLPLAQDCPGITSAGASSAGWPGIGQGSSLTGSEMKKSTGPWSK